MKPTAIFVRWDNDQIEWGDFCKWEDIHRWQELWREDIEWLGIKVDGWYSNAEMLYEAKKRLVMRCYEAHIPVPVEEASYTLDCYPTIVGSTKPVFPYAPWLTALKVIMDGMMEVNTLIRGEDLIDEFCLYRYYAATFKVLMPLAYYLPRMTLKSGDEVSPISKTLGGHKICDMRKAGIQPSYVHALLKASCLKNPEGNWDLDNIKRQPMIEEEEA